MLVFLYYIIQVEHFRDCARYGQENNLFQEFQMLE